MIAGNIRRLEEYLAKRLKSPLPGWESQKKMANIPRVREFDHQVVNKETKMGGVLILLYPRDGSIHIVLMKRTEYNGVHSGQISFPGGGAEKYDKDIVDTALREAREELSIVPSEITVAGKLSELFIPPSNFLVHPVVGITYRRPEFVPEPGEVAEVLEIKLNDLLDPSSMRHKTINIGASLRLRVPCYCLGDRVIWGATAMILTELLDILRGP